MLYKEISFMKFKQLSRIFEQFSKKEDVKEFFISDKVKHFIEPGSRFQGRHRYKNITYYNSQWEKDNYFHHPGIGFFKITYKQLKATRKEMVGV
jgi:LPS sulfotransferase NodH